MKYPFNSQAVADKFQAYPVTIRKKLLARRQLIFEVARDTAGIGALEETLKWGEPAYITSETKSGSTIRIDWKKSDPSYYAMYFNCKTTLVDTFKEKYGDLFIYEGNRAIIFHKDDIIPHEALENCVLMALTYHLYKRNRTV